MTNEYRLLNNAKTGSGGLVGGSGGGDLSWGG